MEKRTFAEIAQEIKSVWTNINPYAAEYRKAMAECYTTNPNDMYYWDTVKSVVLYFLSNASSWRGEDARRIKAELKSMIA